VLIPDRQQPPRVRSAGRSTAAQTTTHTTCSFHCVLNITHGCALNFYLESPSIPQCTAILRFRRNGPQLAPHPKQLWRFVLFSVRLLAAQARRRPAAQPPRSSVWPPPSAPAPTWRWRRQRRRKCATAKRSWRRRGCRRRQRPQRRRVAGGRGGRAQRSAGPRKVSKQLRTYDLAIVWLSGGPKRGGAGPADGRSQSASSCRHASTLFSYFTKLIEIDAISACDVAEQSWRMAVAEQS